MPNLPLSQSEYIALINQAVLADNWNYALSICEEAIEVHPHYAEFKYLLGSIMAHQKDFEGAKKWLELSLAEHCDSIHSASFQLGLIYITSQELTAAKKAWLYLDSLEDKHYFNYFRFGMLCLVDNKFSEAVESLQSGIELNAEFPSINSDMAQVIERIKSVLKPNQYESLN